MLVLNQVYDCVARTAFGDVPWTALPVLSAMVLAVNTAAAQGGVISGGSVMTVAHTAILPAMLVRHQAWPSAARAQVSRCRPYGPDGTLAGARASRPSSRGRNGASDRDLAEEG
jgi:acyl-coenzyme A thioesterase PaaI-like protein